MTRRWFLLAMVLRAAPATAQTVTLDTIPSVQPWPPHERFTFPRIGIPEQPRLAERIDRDLCVDFLGVDPDTATGSIFQGVWGDTVQAIPQSLYSFSWACGQPLPEVLSIHLTGEWCAAYCEDFAVHYAYDLRNGQRLRFDSLFTPEGRKAVDDTLRTQWQAAVAGQLRQIQDSLRVPGLSAEVRVAWQEASEMYRQCVSERSGMRPYVADFEARGDGLRVWSARCSAHVNRHIDELGQVAIDLSYDRLRPSFIPEVCSLLK
jgi:hypothetical protein